MKLCSTWFAGLMVMACLATVKQALGLRVVIDREECFSHKVEYEWDTVHSSFVVVKYDSTWQTEHGVDLVVSAFTELPNFILLGFCK